MRQARGQILAALGDGALVGDDRPAALGTLSDETWRTLIDGLIADGLISADGDAVHLAD